MSVAFAGHLVRCFRVHFAKAPNVLRNLGPDLQRYLGP